MMFPKQQPVRLKGKEMRELRVNRWRLDDGRCIDCFSRVWLDAPLGHPRRMHLAHIKSRGAGGSDTLDNTVTKCAECHGKEHNGKKPCPKKEIYDTIVRSN